MPKIQIRYFASLREERGLSQETVETSCLDPRSLYRELKKQHNLSLDESALGLAINDTFARLDDRLQDHDTVVFIPPVAGG